MSEQRAERHEVRTADRTAAVLIKQHGEDAPIHAAMRADELLEAGDLDGCAVWKRILRAVGELQGTAPAAGDQIH